MNEINVEEAVKRVLVVAPYLYKQPQEMWKALQGKYSYRDVTRVCKKYQDEDEEILDSLDPETVRKGLESGLNVQDLIDNAKKKKQKTKG